MLFQTILFWVANVFHGSILLLESINKSIAKLRIVPKRILLLVKPWYCILVIQRRDSVFEVFMCTSVCERHSCSQKYRIFYPKHSDEELPVICMFESRQHCNRRTFFGKFGTFSSADVQMNGYKIFNIWSCTPKNLNRKALHGHYQISSPGIVKRIKKGVLGYISESD